MTAVDLGPQSQPTLHLYDQPEPRLRITPRTIGAVAAVAALYVGGGMLLNLAEIDITIPRGDDAPTITMQPWPREPVVVDNRPPAKVQPTASKTSTAATTSTIIPTYDDTAITATSDTVIGEPVDADPGPLVGPTIVTPPAPPPLPMIRNPDWLSRPTGDQLSRLYPSRAAAREMGGRALMECRVTAQGTMTGCVVISETPAGLGFGDAALASTRYFRMSPRTVDGQAVEGAKVRIPMGFNLAQ